MTPSSVAWLSPVLGFQAAALPFSIATLCTFFSLLISHRGPKTEINEQKEVVSVNRAGLLVTLVAAMLQTLAAVAASVSAVAVLG